MNPLEALLTGIAPEHAPALVAGLLAALWLGRLPPRAAGALDRWALALLGVTAAVHLALPLNPHHGPLVSAAFVATGAGYAALARQAYLGRRWRAASALLVAANLAGYLAVLLAGEEADQVGIVTALVELTVLGLALVPLPQPGRPRRMARLTASTATVVAAALVGAVIWGASFTAHATMPTPAATEAAGTGEHDHHDHAGRAQAGVLMRPLGAAHHPTAEDQQAATELAAATSQATARYTDLNTALAAGYRAPLGGLHGTDVHLEHAAFKKDGRTLDPQRPEMLVYAVEDGRATLLGAVYVMDDAGRPGPMPGGSITRWHAHNLCLTALPPGIGIVTPFGGCPPFSVAVASPEMMHVWVVDNPGGPFAEGLDKAWVRALNSRAGLAFPAG